MFVKVDVILPQQSELVIVPTTAIVHAPYGDSVFVVEDKKPGSPGMDKTQDGRPVKIARQQFVRLGEERGDFVAVAEGVKSGEELVTAGAFKLRNGAPVVVDNSVKPKPELSPQLKNR
jgi:membrane fusion protein (multidrug efflux system)